MNKHPRKNLRLRSETIKHLQSAELAHVAGGATIFTIGTCAGCPTNLTCTSLDCTTRATNTCPQEP